MKRKKDRHGKERKKKKVRKRKSYVAHAKQMVKMMERKWFVFK